LHDGDRRQREPYVNHLLRGGSADHGSLRRLGAGRDLRGTAARRG
jgi:hypothetical protein